MTCGRPRFGRISRCRPRRRAEQRQHLNQSATSASIKQYHHHEQHDPSNSMTVARSRTTRAAAPPHRSGRSVALEEEAATARPGAGSWPGVSDVTRGWPPRPDLPRPRARASERPLARHGAAQLFFAPAFVKTEKADGRTTIVLVFAITIQ